LESRNFEKVEMFDGLAIKSSSMECHSLMEKHEKAKAEVELASLHMDDGETGKSATEIYDIIGLHVRGEALTIVRGVPDMNGVEAWRRLCLPEHASSNVGQAHGRIIVSPGKAKSVNELAAMVEKWELKVRMFENKARRCSARRLGLQFFSACVHKRCRTLWYTSAT
jgi:hypothetical protein